MQDDEVPLAPLELIWTTAEPARVLELLGDSGLRHRSDGRFEALPIVVSVVTDPGALVDSLTVGDPLAADPDTADGPRLAALGWATVDTERATGEFERALEGEASPDRALGAVGRRLERRGPMTVVLLEPITEGRIAAALARHGEGPIAIYLEGASAPERALVSAPTALGRAGRLVVPAQPSGPFIIVLE